MRRSWLAALVLVGLALGCNTTHYLNAGDRAWSRGDAKRALSNWRAARGEEGKLLGRRGRRRLDDKVSEAVTRLARPALKAAATAIEAGNGGRALDLLLPLYGGRGLYRNLASRDLRDARERLLPDIGRAISLASGVDVRALTKGEGAVDAASSRVAAVRRRIERFVPRHARRKLLDLLGDVARPAIAKGWQLVDAHLLKARTEEAVALALRLAAVFPEDGGLKAQLRRTRSRAVAHHQARARANRGYPGIQWAHLSLAARYGGSGSGAERIRAHLRRTEFRVASATGCPAVARRIVNAVRKGSGGIPVRVAVQLGRCRQVDKHWTTKKRVTWLEWRTRQVRVKEWYTAYKSERKCQYVQRYANTTCTSRRVGNGWVRRTCRPNYSTVQRCRNVSVPVRRQRWVTRTQRYQVRLSLIRVIHHYRTGFAVSGQAKVSWPGGGTTVSLSYNKGLEDFGFSDRAGKRVARRVSVSQLQGQATEQLRARVHRLAGAALVPKARQLRQQASLAAEAGQDLRAADLALQSWLLGARLGARDFRRFAALLRVPASIARAPARWGSVLRARRVANQRRRRPRRRRMPLNMEQAFGSVDGPPASELVNPHLPSPDRGARALYRELGDTAWRDGPARDLSGGVSVGVSPSPLDKTRLGLTLRSSVRVGAVLTLRGGADLGLAGLGTRGFELGADVASKPSRRSTTITGFGLRYARHDVTPAPGLGGSVRRSSNLDLSYFLRTGGTFGFWMRLSLNVARWLGDDAYAHFHPLSAGVHLNLGPAVLRGGATWHVGGGGVRWLASLGFRF